MSFTRSRCVVWEAIFLQLVTLSVLVSTFNVASVLVGNLTSPVCWYQAPLLVSRLPASWKTIVRDISSYFVVMSDDDATKTTCKYNDAV